MHFAFDVSCTGRRACAERQLSRESGIHQPGAGLPNPGIRTDWEIGVRRADRDIHAYTHHRTQPGKLCAGPSPPLLPPLCSTDSSFASGSSRRQNDFRSHIRTYENRPMRTSVLRDNKSYDVLKTGGYGMTDKKNTICGA